MTFELTDRAVLGLSGPDAREFLQGLVTQDVRKVEAASPSYAALLTPQGKILFDFLMYEQDGTLLLDTPARLREPLARRLSLYRLRAKVEIAPRDDLAIVWSADGTSPALLRDPRVASLGYRAIMPRGASEDGAEHYRAVRLALGVPEGEDFGQDRMFALDADLDELGGVAFDKGCYVGQELTARMKHRGTARKRLLPVLAQDGRAVPQPPATIASGAQEVGTISSVYGTTGFALVRLDRLEECGGTALQAGDIALRLVKPDWLFP